MSNINVYSIFSSFCTNLEIPQSVKNTVDTRIRTIAKRINADFWNIDFETTHYMVVGSYGRHTAIKTSDIDLIVELPWSEYTRYNNYLWNGQSSLLQTVKQSLQKTYSSSAISGDGQVVDIDFSDGIKFEVVPAFKYSDGSYCYADTNNGSSWRSMNPAKELMMFVYMDSQYNGNLTRLCRMARAWKDKMTVLMPGILIDTIAYDFLGQYKYASKSFTYFDWMSRDFFEYIINHETKSSWTKFGSGDIITKDYGVSVNSDSKKAYALTLEAIEAESKKWIYTYHDKWREIYGAKFPSA